MKFLSSFSVFFILILPFGVHGQELLLLNATSNDPIEGASIYESSKKKYTLSNENGKADLSVFSKNDQLYIQYYGYQSYTLKLLPEYLDSGLTILLKEEEQTLDEVILSVARKATSRKKIAEKVNIIGSDEIKLQRPANGADLLGLSPGVRIQKSQGGGGSPVIRGFEANRLLLVVDGVRMNNAIYRSGHLQNAITVNPNIVERVEVVFGSSSVGYGSDALGGVIHYYTRNPLINSEKKVISRFSSNFSSADQATTNSISTEVSFKKWASLTSINYSNFGDLRMGKNRTHGFKNWGLTNFYSENSRSLFSPTPLKNENPFIQKNTGYNQIDLFQKLLVQLDGQSQFILNFQYSNSSDISRYDKLSEERNGSLRYAEWFYGPQKRILISPQYKFYKNKRFLNSGKIIFAYQDIEESRINRSYGSLTRNYQREGVKALSLNGDFEFDFKKNHSFSYGFEGIFNKVSSFAFKKDLIVNENQIIGYDPNLPIPTRYPSAGSSYSSFAVFINWIWDLNELLTLNAGIRLTYTGLNASWKEWNNIDAFLSSVKNNSDALTETIALTYRPSKKIQWNVIFSNGFRNPNIDDVGKIRESRGILVVPNPFLYPEYAYNFEVGLTNYLKQSKNYMSLRGFITLISRHIGRDKYLIFADKTTEDLNTIIYNGEELETYANNNLGNRYLFGASMDYYYSFTESISTQGNLSYISAVKDELYGPLPSISPLFGSLLLTFKKEAWHASLRFQFSDSKSPENYSLGGEDGLKETPLLSENSMLYSGTPSWNDLSLLTQYKLKENISFRLGLDNIFDVHYRTFASGISAPGRNIKIGLNLSF